MNKDMVVLAHTKDRIITTSCLAIIHNYTSRKKSKEGNKILTDKY